MDVPEIWFEQNQPWNCSLLRELFLKSERLKTLKVMQSCFAFRKQQSFRGPRKRRANPEGTSAIISWFEQCLCLQTAAAMLMDPTCPHKAPVAFWRGGDQRLSCCSSFGKTLLTRGEWSKGLLQPCHPPPTRCFQVPASRFLSVSKKERKKSAYAKQHILVTPPLPITRWKESLF